MNRITLNEFHRDPALTRRIAARAHRERNRAIRAGFAWLGRHLVPRFDFHPDHWLERLG